MKQEVQYRMGVLARKVLQIALAWYNSTQITEKSKQKKNDDNNYAFVLLMTVSATMRAVKSTSALKTAATRQR